MSIHRSGRFGRLFMLCATLLLSACASFYVDTATKDVARNEFKQPATPKPVYLVFEFQTKGAPNATATSFLKDQVTEQVKKSGLFSAVLDKPAPDAVMLQVTLNNVPLTDDAFSKGFATGLTFGIAGSVVTDGYLCTVSALQPGNAKPVTANAKHALHTAMGNANPPANAEKSENMEQAVRTMTRQILDNALKSLSLDPAFG